MSVSVVRSRSVSSATTRSLSDFCTRSPPTSVRALAGPNEEAIVLGGPPRLGFCLPAASCLGQWVLLCGNRFRLLLQLLEDPPRPRRIDVDAGPHRTHPRAPPKVRPLGS